MPRKDLPKRLLAYLSTLICSQGQGAGEPLRILPWQRRYLRNTFSPNVAISALSVGRGAGKSTLVGAIAAAAVAGPLSQRRGDTVIAAPSYSQSRIPFEACREFLRPLIEADPSKWQVADSRNHASIEFKPLGSRVRCLGHKSASMHGSQSVLTILDEPAMYGEHEGRRLYAASRTGLGKLPGARLLVIGTQSEDADHFFSSLLDRRRGMSDYSQLHAADKSADPYKRPQWHAANPSLKYFPSLLAEYVRDAKAAQNDDGERAAFLSLRLNLGTSTVARRELVSVDDWSNIEGDAPADGPYILAADCGDVGALTAFAGFWPATGRLEVLGCFPAVPDLLARGKRDHVGTLYERCSAAGDIVVNGNRVVSLEATLGEVIDRWGMPDACTADSFHADRLQDALENVGIPLALDVRRGLTHAVSDLRGFREAVLANLVTPRPQLLLRACMKEATVATVMDARERLAKRNEAGRRVRGRDDAAAAAMLSVAFAMRGDHATPEPTYQAVQMVGGEMVTV